MTNFTGIFPLDIIVYPGDALHLHVFEPRYKQLINDCIAEGRTFGIPCVLNNKIQEFGTLLEITELVETYEDGEMDVKTKGLEIFRVLQIVDEVPEKLYKGAIVSYPENILEKEDTRISDIILSEVEELFTRLDVPEKFNFPKGDANLSYQIGHFVGFTRQQEYELLSLFSETQRLEYIRRHLKKAIPTLDELAEVKERIQRNGHFQNLSLEGF